LFGMNLYLFRKYFPILLRREDIMLSNIYIIDYLSISKYKILNLNIIYYSFNLK